MFEDKQGSHTGGDLCGQVFLFFVCVSRMWRSISF